MTDACTFWDVRRGLIPEKERPAYDKAVQALENGESVPFEDVFKHSYLYHGTSWETAQKIAREGFKPGFERHVFFTADIEDAIDFAKQSETPAVVRVLLTAGAARGMKCLVQQKRDVINVQCRGDVPLDALDPASLGGKVSVLRLVK